jgi:hypothetical protein
MSNNSDVVANATKYISYGTSTGTTIVGLSMSEFAAVIGVILAVATYLTSLYFQLKKEKRDNDLHILKLKQLAEGKEILNE